MSNSNALKESEIDQLGDLLDQLRDIVPCVGLEGLDGMCTALAVMTRSIEPDELWEIIVDDHEAFDMAEFGDERRALLESLISRRIQHTERLLSNNTLSDLSDPRAYQAWVMDGEQLAKTDPEVAAAIELGEWPELGLEWGIGFITVVEHFESDWRLDDELLDEELNPMLAPFYALVLPRDEWPDDIKDEDIEGDTREAWLASAIWSSYELWEYWRYHAPKPKGVPFIKTSTPGRNDPCDCGSGKKYKQCHGKAEAD